MNKSISCIIILIFCVAASSCKKSEAVQKINPVGYFKGKIQDNFLGVINSCVFVIRDNGTARSYIASDATETDTANMVKKEQVWTLSGSTFHSEDIVAANLTGKGKLDATLTAPTDSITGIFSNNLASYPIALKRQ